LGAPSGGLGSIIASALSGKTGANAGTGLAQQSAELQGADPTMIARQLDRVGDVLARLFTMTWQTMPNVANQISATMKALTKAQKEIGQAAQVSEVVGQQPNMQPAPPISNSAAQPAVPQPQPDMSGA
jgi:hypothetical protein